jgi:SRSO17 transposase
VEETFQFTKNETGLDHYQVRTYHAWYRHITLSMLAAAFLAVTAHTERLLQEKGAPHPTTNNYSPYPAMKSDDSGPP